MTSNKQKKANKANAKLSSGPRTRKGKERSSLNAIGHGLSKTSNLPSGSDIATLQALFESDGLSENEAAELSEAHYVRSRVRTARHDAWLSLYHHDAFLDPKEREFLHDVATRVFVDGEPMGRKLSRQVFPFLFKPPYKDQQDRNRCVTSEFLDKQRRLNRYDVKAVSTLSKLYKKAYKIN